MDKVWVVCLFVLALGVYLSLIEAQTKIKVKGSYIKLGKRLIEQNITTKKIEKISKKIWGRYVLINKEIYEREIYNGILMLKNLAIVQRDLPMSRDFILEQLMVNSTLLKVTYGEMLSYSRKGQQKEFEEVMYRNAPFEGARRVSLLISQIDKINPMELLEQITLLEEIMLQEKETLGVKKAERNSIMITSFATATIFILLLNFTIVVVFMDAMSLLEGIF